MEAVEGTHGGTEHGLGADCAPRRGLELRGEACIAWHAYAARILRGRRIEDRGIPIGVHSKPTSFIKIKLRGEAWGGARWSSAARHALHCMHSNLMSCNRINLHGEA